MCWESLQRRSCCKRSEREARLAEQGRIVGGAKGEGVAGGSPSARWKKPADCLGCGIRTAESGLRWGKTTEPLTRCYELLEIDPWGISGSARGGGQGSPSPLRSERTTQSASARAGSRLSRAV